MGCCGRIMNDVMPYVNNAMLAAILSLLIVILFVLLLHVYARWFLGRAHTRGAMPQSTTYTYDIMTSSSSTMCPANTKGGLDRTAVDAIPMFVYEIRPSSSDGQDYSEKKKSRVENELLECAICLSVFEEKEVGRSLPRCSHAFHVNCIDTWLLSHSTCPVCRSHLLIHDHDRDRTVEIEDGDRDPGETLVQIVVVENHDHSNDGGDNK